MSSTSNGESMLDVLLLDFALQAQSDAVKTAVALVNGTSLTMAVNPEDMDDHEWDLLVDNIIRAKRCITL